MKTLPENWKPDKNTRWWNISRDYKLSESFIRKYQDKINWYWISEYQELSESFIREFKDKVNWNYISSYQTLSEDFIREFKDQVNWNWILIYQKHISNKILNQYQYRMSFTLTGARIRYY